MDLKPPNGQRTTENGLRSPSLWDMIEEASALEGATKLHLAIGRPPMVRVGDAGLRPLRPGLPVLGYLEIMLLLARVVEPEQWDRLERTGEGEIRLTQGGKPIVLTLFRASESWCAVVHL